MEKDELFPKVKPEALESRYEQRKIPFSKLMGIRERAIADSMVLLTQDEVLEKVKKQENRNERENDYSQL